MYKYLFIGVAFMVPLVPMSAQSGCISGDCVNGHGTYHICKSASLNRLYSDFYLGEKVDCSSDYKKTSPDGLVYSWMVEQKYVGEWRNGNKHGQGIWTEIHYSNPRTQLNVILKEKYAGQWYQDLKHGQGTLTSYGYNGNKNMEYVGNWQSGKRHGYGISSVLHDSGKWYKGYVGEWQNGKAHGRGTLTFRSGDKYVGSFYEEAMQGHGVFSFADGRKDYEGEFHHDASGSILLSGGGSKISGKVEAIETVSDLEMYLLAAFFMAFIFLILYMVYRVISYFFRKQSVKNS